MVQKRLRELAALATEGRLPTRVSVQEGARVPSATFVMGDYAARYETDARARIVRLVAVENRVRMAPHEASNGKPERLFE